MDELRLLRPMWLLAIPAAWGLVYWFLRLHHRGGVWQDYIDPELAPFILSASGDKRGRPGSWFAAIIASIIFIALAGPVWEREPVPVFRTESSLVIALDLSASMNAEDVEPSRLARAKFKIADLINLRKGGQTGLLVFAAQSFVVTPLTDDTGTLLAQLRGLDTSIMPVQGSEPASALTLANELLQQAGAIGGHLLLVTDGADTDALERASAVMASSNTRVSILGIGSAEGAPIPDRNGGFAKDARGEMIVSSLNDHELNDFATAHGGLYLDLAASDDEISRLHAYVSSDHQRQSQQLDDLAAEQWREFGPWLLLLALPAVAVGFRRGALFAVVIASGSMSSQPVLADWFRTDDQAGQKAFEQADYPRAATRFQRRDWRGSARYRAGDFDAALEDFAELEDPAVHYNRGNALARLGRFEEAVAAYEKSLESRPGDEDTLHNKSLIEDLLKQQQSPPEQGQQGDNQQQDQEQQPQDQDEQQQSENQQGGGQQEQENSQELSDGNSMGGGEREEQDQAKSADQSQQGQERQAEDSESENDEPGDEAQTQMAQSEQAENESDAERAQATEQWLRQIPDDPSGLLRRKFLYQYKKHYGSEPYEGDRW